MRFDVITIGSATRDALFKSKEFRVLKDPRFDAGKALAMGFGTKIKIDDLHFFTGGSATNTAVTFSRQGFKVGPVISIGNDLSGDTVIADLKKEGADTRLIQKNSRLPTAYSVILEHISGERTILTHRGANESLSYKKVPWGKIRARWIYLGSISADLNILKSAIANKKKYGARIAWNPGGTDLSLGLKKLRPYLKHIDMFSANQEEISNLLSIPYSNVDKIFKRFDDLIDGIAIMTRGPKGLFVSDGKILWQVGVFKEKGVVDRTGAGDAFSSGFVAGLMHKKKSARMGEYSPEQIEYAVRLGSANSTSKIEKLGAKTGLLTKKDFNNKRWRRLSMKTKKL